ncbi:MAG: hypothetical protein QOH97_5647 [Actinoplanes sp.]|jgi:histidinol-phosphate/aromatic aminotransferase/cobyric acid decarboxylase-like protein|nr:hypothetical protein [Actinoplanes sp.]
MARSGVEILHTGAHSASIFDLSRSMGEGVQIVDFCIPCNPYFPTPEMFAELSRDLTKILKYYPSDASTITAKLSSVLGLHPQTVAMANGSTELITWIDHLLIKSSVAIPIPTFGRWTDQPLETGKRVDMFPLRERDGFRLDLDEYVQFIRDRGSRVAVVCNVNNPDGGYLNRRDVIRFMDDLADLDLVVIDESFIDFSDAEQYPSVGPEAVIRPNVVVLKSLGKNFGLHGIRFGYLMANPAIAGRIAKALPKWNLNSLAEKVVFMIQDHQADYEESLRLLSRDRRGMATELSQIPGLTVFPSQGNFILVKLPTDWSGVSLRDFLVARHGVYTRECGNKLGMTSQFMRLVVRPAADVDRLIDGLDDYAGDRRTSAAADPWSTGPAAAWNTGTAPASPAPWSADPAATSSSRPAPSPASRPAPSPASRPASPPSASRSGRPYPVDPLTDDSYSTAARGAGEAAEPRRSAAETGYDRRWRIEDDVTPYPPRRAATY